MWIIQEITLARSRLRHWLICGHESITCHELQAFEGFLEMFHRSEILNRELIGYEEALICSFLSSPFMLSRPLNGTMELIEKVAVINPSKRYLIYSISAAALHASETDPRDFVYAMISLIANNIEPNYDKPIRDVYLEAVLNSGITSCVIDCLDFSGRGQNYENDHNLPSWLPDFSKINRDCMFTTLGNHSLLRTIELQPAEITQQDTLRIQGVTYGLVGMTKPLQFNDVALDSGKYLLKLFVDYLVEFWELDAIEGIFAKLDWCRTNKPLRTLIDVLSCGFKSSRDRFVIPSLPNMSLSKAEIDILYHVTSYRRYTGEEKATVSERVGIPPNGLLINVLLVMALSGNNAVDVMENVIEICMYRDLVTMSGFEQMIKQAKRGKLFRTDEGHLGIGPPNLQSGDLLCALDQCRSSFLLRKRGSHWEHIGTCYVPELYNMDTAEMITKGEIQVETYEIH
ncbi:hypothetical protein M434DRAFT_11472 [Hypoxylon sp. CO27-5]|nr:hypothetical protein M434DRAFT_11472 [Hypoxylon sp. CO27-5]